jgi:hypothetical protein
VIQVVGQGGEKPRRDRHDALVASRDHAVNVKRWQDGQMVRAGSQPAWGEAAKQLRRVNGHLHLPALRAMLDATITTVTPTKEDAA